MAIITPQQAVERLRQGDVVALPTETVYGLAARADNEDAVNKIFSTKQRPYFDPLIVHVPDLASARKLSADWPDIYDVLAAKFWPGPLTLVSKKRKEVSRTVTAGLDSVALRVPSHPLFLKILGDLNLPLAAPSANRFGRTSPTLADHVENEYFGGVAVVDGGACSVGIESTVLSAEKLGTTWRLHLLRPGGVSRSELRDFLKAKKISAEILRTSAAVAPGQLKEHYQPVSPVILLNDKIWSKTVQSEIESRLGRKLKSALQLSLLPTPYASARVLYSELHRLATDPDVAVWIHRTKDQRGEDWEVIWDRVERAARYNL